MRHLVVCCDGTWNTPQQEAVSNANRLYNALAEAEEAVEAAPAQLRYYHSGVGTDGGPLNWVLGGVTGAGLSRNVMDAYHWLTRTYQPGDVVSLFGFSRGAYTVRSLAGMVAACGLLDTARLDEPTTWRQIEHVYHRRYQPSSTPDPRWRDGLRFTFDPARADEIPVRFIGVWETVGSLGIPDYFGWLNLLDTPWRHEFHDVKLNPKIRHARHAVAIDEARGPFTPTLWSEPAPGQDLEQVWFPGSHLDVGGCYPQRGLGDAPLLWMIEQARDTVGLVFHKRVLDQIRPDPLDVLHDDNLGVSGIAALLAPVLEPLLERFFEPRPRPFPLIDPQVAESPLVHASAHRRQQTPPITSGPYRPTRVLGVGDSATVTVSARPPWNWTGLYLEAGDYTFVAESEWADGRCWSGPAGTSELSRFPLTAAVHVIGTVTGLAEQLFRRLTGNEHADFLLSRRVEEMPWMSLIGVVANNAQRGAGGAGDHELIAIGAGRDHHVHADGYLHAFANDAWGCYGDNEGDVTLTVVRTA
jgi:hypothetical protein